MDVHDLVSLFESAKLTPIKAIPVAHCGFIDVAIRPAAGIQRYFVCATRVTDEWGAVTSSGPAGCDKRVTAHVFIPAIGVQIEPVGPVINKAAHDPSLSQWTELSSYRIQGCVRQSRRAVPSDPLPQEALHRYF